jgi:hypothetical protein
MGRHVFEDRRGDDGSRRYQAAHLNRDGCLVIETHDLGGVFGEYEAAETFSSEQTQALRESLGEDLIAVIAERWPDSSRGFREYTESTGVGRGKVWNRIGD